MSKPLTTGKVLVSIRLGGKAGVPEVGDWISWLTGRIPEDVASINIEAVFESTSSLCLMTMPIAVWDILGKGTVCEFVAFVDSSNILLVSAISHFAP